MQSRMRPRFTLFESTRRAPVRPTVSAGLSVAAHGGVVAAWMLMTSLAAGYTEVDSATAARFLYPLLQTAPRPREERVSFVGLQSNVAVPTLPGSVYSDAPEQKLPRLEAPVEPPTQVETEPQEAMSELEVDSTAMRSPDSEGPVYPPEMLAKHIEGVALVRFVVSAEGTVDISSVRIMMASDSAFAVAARNALPKMRFRPAWFSGKPVSQLVEQAFTFKLAKPEQKKGATNTER
jgi:TonB family protein